MTAERPAYSAPPRRPSGASGSAMVVLVVVVFVLAAIGAAFLADSHAKAEATRWTQTAVAAAQIADAGVDMARQALYAGLGNGWNDELAVSAAAARSPDPAVYAAPATPSAFVFGRAYAFGAGSYRVYVTDDNDADGQNLSDVNTQVILASIATHTNGATCRVRAAVYFVPGTFSPTSAITVGGNLRIQGNPSVLGTDGKVHANGDLLVGGSPTISQCGSASGSVVITGSPPAPAQGWQSGAAPVPLPDVQPSQFRAQADYILASTGRIYDRTGALVFDGTGGGNWNGLSYRGGGDWKQTGNTAPPPGAYFAEGGVLLAGSPGSAADPAPFTLYAMGSIEISGNPAIKPAQLGILLLTRADLKITGNPTEYLEGFMGAHEQLMLSGNPTLSGAIVAEDAIDLSPVVSSGTYIDLTGNFTLTYNGGLTVPLTVGSPGVSIRSWERLQ